MFIDLIEKLVLNKGEIIDFVTCYFLPSTKNKFSVSKISLFMLHFHTVLIHLFFRVSKVSDMSNTISLVLNRVELICM